MSGERNARFLTFPAQVDMSTDHMFRFAKLDALGAVQRCDVAGQEAIGIIADNAAATGREVAVMTDVGSVFDVEAGGNITAGARVMTDSVGRAVALGSGDTASLGVALTGAATGEIIPVLFQPLGAFAATVS